MNKVGDERAFFQCSGHTWSDSKMEVVNRLADVYKWSCPNPLTEPAKDGKYRKKPVVVTARQFDGTVESGTKIITWMAKCDPSVSAWGDACEGFTLYINTLEGVMTVTPGDWVIRGIAGEFYPCKAAIFAATYEGIEDDVEESFSSCH